MHFFIRVVISMPIKLSVNVVQLFKFNESEDELACIAAPTA